MTRTDTDTQTYIAELEARREERDEVGDARESTELSYRIRMLREGTPLDIDVRALALGDRRIPIRPATVERELVAETPARERAADYRVLDRFDTLRRRAGHDYGAGQRTRELRNLRVELSMLAPGTELEGFELTPAELRAAFERVSAPKIARLKGEGYRSHTPATMRTRETWNRLARELGTDEPLGVNVTALAAALAGETHEVIREAAAAGEVDESPAEELGRLRRELSELDRETPEFAEVLDRIAVLTREQAETRRRERRVDELKQTIREAELELEQLERPDIAELREELNGLETGIAIARSEEELKALGRLAYSARDRVYGTPGIPRDIPQRVDDLLARARTRLMTFDGGRA